MHPLARDMIVSVRMADPVHFIEVLTKLAQIVALCIGAGWVLWNYRLNRTHVPRLELAINASVRELGSYGGLLISISVKNPSLRSVSVRIDDSVVLLSKLVLPNEAPEPRTSEWGVPEVVYPLKWNIIGSPEKSRTLAIEPGLTIAHEQLHLVPKPDSAAIFLLVLWIPEARRVWWRRRHSRRFGDRLKSRKWRATKIIFAGGAPLLGKEA